MTKVQQNRLLAKAYILQIARNIVKNDGMECLSLRRIMSEAGYTSGLQLTRYFPGELDEIRGLL